MPDNLSENKCEACSIDAQALTEQEISEFLPQIPSWIVHEEEGINSPLLFQIMNILLILQNL